MCPLRARHMLSQHPGTRDSVWDPRAEALGLLSDSTGSGDLRGTEPLCLGGTAKEGPGDMAHFSINLPRRRICSL